MKTLPTPRHELDLFALYFLASFICMPLLLQFVFSIAAFVIPLPTSPYKLALTPPWTALSVFIGGASVIAMALKMGIRFKYSAKLQYWLYGLAGVLVLHFIFRKLGGHDAEATRMNFLAIDPWRLISLVFLSPIFEEYVCRGLLYAWLCKKYSSEISAIVTTLAFLLMHSQVFFGLYLDALAILILSSLLIFLRVKSGALGPAMLVHCLNNGLALLG
jgi:membrane protease YdiL (CAAX protease family)